MPELSGKLLNQIVGTLLDAFPTRDHLRMLVRIGLEENLESIADGANQQFIVFDLVTWAERTGRIDDLITAAMNQNPRNRAVCNLWETWQTNRAFDVEESKIIEPLLEHATIGIRYKNQLFHTVLEARWAVFFDELGLEWEYEPEEFKLTKHGLYTPDFLIHTSERWNYWIDIQPMMAGLHVGSQWYDVDDPVFDSDRKGILKLAELVGSGKRTRECKYGLMIYGEPSYDRHQVLIEVDSDSYGSPEDTICTLGSCYGCDSLAVGYDRDWYIITNTKTTYFYRPNCRHREVHAQSTMFDFAFRRAMAARFDL